MKGFEGIAHRTGVELLLADAGKGTGDIALALDTVSHNHHFIEKGVVLLEGDTDVGTSVHFLFLGEVAHVTEGEGGIGGGIEGVAAVKVGDGTHTGPILDDRHADEGFSGLVGHRSCHFLLLRTLRKHRLRHAEEHANGDEKH